MPAADEKAAFPCKAGTPGKAAEDQRHNHSLFRNFLQLATDPVIRFLHLWWIAPIVWTVSELAR